MSVAPLTGKALAVPHGFFTRQGGVSEGPYASLNGGLSGGDDRDAVMENRVRIANHLGGGVLLGCTQVHGPAVAVADAPWAPGHGPRADALVTARRGLPLGIITADCTPVLLADAEAGVVGAVHAGWRGAVAGVLEATIDAMVSLGARVGDIAATIGPSIRQPSYEVGPDLRDAVLAHNGGDAQFFAPGTRPGRWQFDLAGYCAARLRGIGTVEVLAADTLPDDGLFWSHRRRTLAGGGPIGHQVSAIML